MTDRNKENRFQPEDEKVATELEKDSNEAPYSDDYMPDSPRHGVISSQPGLFEEDVEPLVGEGTVSEETDQYDEENIKEYNTPD